MTQITKALNTFISNQSLETTPKKTLGALHSMDAFVDAFKNSLSTFLPENLQQNWNTGLNDFQTKITDCMNCIYVSDKKDLLKDIKLVKENYFNDLEKVKKIIKNQDLINKDKIALLTEAYENLARNQQSNNGQLQDIASKLDRMEKKIELRESISKIDVTSLETLRTHFLQKIKNIVPEDMTLETLKALSEKEHLQLVKSYKSLKNEWKQAIQYQRTLEDKIQRHIFNLEAMDIINNLRSLLPQSDALELEIISLNENECAKDLPKKTYFQQLMDCLEVISTHHLANGFHKRYRKEPIKTRHYQREDEFYKRDFSHYTKNIQSYVQHISTLAENEDSLIQLDKSFYLSVEPIENVLEKISKHISAIGEREKEIFNFSDKKINESLIGQDERSINKLKELASTIKYQWNELFLSIRKAKFQNYCFLRMKNITEKMGWCYYLAEDIFSDLRNLRKTDQYGANHRAILNYNASRFNILTQLVLNTYKELDNKSIHIFDIKNVNLADDKILPLINLRKLATTKTIQLHERITLENEVTSYLASSLSPINENKQVESEDEKINAEIDAIALNWTSEGNQTAIREKLKNQIIEFNDLTKQYDSNVRAAFDTTLPEICQLAADAINREGNAIKYNDSYDGYYENDMKNAYYAESKVGQTAQYVVEQGVNVVCYLGKGIYTFATESVLGYESEKEPAMKVSFDFEPVISPFEIMKNLKKESKEVIDFPRNNSQTNTNDDSRELDII